MQFRREIRAVKFSASTRRTAGNGVSDQGKQSADLMAKSTRTKIVHRDATEVLKLRRMDTGRVLPAGASQSTIYEWHFHIGTRPYKPMAYWAQTCQAQCISQSKEL